MYRGSGGDEEVFRIKAFSYYLDGSRIVKTALSPREIYEEDVSENVRLKKFTFPNARHGSVLEYTYDLNSPYIYIFRDWVFQPPRSEERCYGKECVSVGRSGFQPDT